jgi:hypothetical protein
MASPPPSSSSSPAEISLPAMEESRDRIHDGHDAEENDDLKLSVGAT